MQGAHVPAAAAAVQDDRRDHQASFRTQAGALLRKNAAFQRRNRRSNCCITVTPVLFIMLLFVIQKLVNSAFDTPETNCGCECLRCCDNNASGSGEVCRDATTTAPCYPGTYTGDCKTYNKSNCGLQYSDQQNAAYCAIDNPSTWPPLLQVPMVQYRAEPYRPAAAYLYTANDPQTARAIAANLFQTANLSDTAEVANATELFRAGLAQNPTVVNGDALSEVGYVLGTSADNYRSAYLEAAFVQNLPVYNMVPNCSVPVAVNSTEALGSLLGNASSNGINFGADVECTAQQAAFVGSPDAIDRELYCGFYQAKCNASDPFAENAYVHAFDFGNTTLDRFSLNMWYNNTNALNATGGPPYLQRMNQGLNMAVNAFLKWSLGAGFEAPLLGLSEMPKPETNLSLDFASLLGPIFFTWLSQLLLPLLLVNMVYEKERGLRIMMKMHGLGDGAYFVVQYLWFMVLYCAYMAVLLLIGSAVDIGFFRKNSYGLQIVFYFVWGNCLVAFGFVLSTFFSKVKNAVVCGYIYTIGSGLLGYLLFQQLIERGYSWVWVLEIIPSFALYRGLYEFSQYAFKADYGNGEGLGFNNINDGYNGMATALGIMAIEWAVFLVLAWYLEQVLPSGTGVHRSPLFFLHSLRQRRRRRSGSVADVEMVAPPQPRKSVDADYAVGLEGDDVAEERQRVAALPTDGTGDAIIVRGLRKIYPAQGGNPPKVAVRGLDLGIRRGEVFGLLGPNGAGKTSAIHMMIGFLEPTAGTAYVEGLDIRQDMAAVYSLMGVCPQHDLLWEQLTPTEHLNFYGRLKGLKKQQLADAVEAGLRAVNLWAVRRKRVGQFSGGMKRRLSVAISFIGDPRVVYLDECSTGLDPASRRNLWDVVKKQRTGRGIILTTHSMEEAEVLCDRLGIFVDGQLVCVGAPKEITARYGGYLVFTITTPLRQQEVEAADRLVRQLSPGARRTYALGGTQKYELPTTEVTLSQVFATMERAKGSLEVLDWGVANATLEEVFIKFARQIGAEGEK